MIVYRITNLINKKIYIGKDKFNNPKYFGSGILIKKAIIKYGISNFKKEILFESNNEDEINEKEKFFIKTYESTKKHIGYNIALGGNGGDVFTNNPNKQKILDKMKATVSNWTEEKRLSVCSKISIGVSLNPNRYWLNKKFPKDSIEKRKKSLSLFYSKNESKLKQRKISDEHRQKISKNNARYWLGKHISESAKNKLREKRKQQNMEYIYAQYNLIDPNGNPITIKNVSKFLYDNKLSKTQFYSLIRNKRTEYKGWKVNYFV